MGYQMQLPECLRAGCIGRVTLICGLIGCHHENANRSNPPTTSITKSTNSPIHLLDLAGQEFDIWQNPNTMKVVLFARTDCPISNRTAPEIRRLYEKYHRRAVEFYLIYVDPREQPDAIRAHIQEYQLPCRGLRDPKHTFVAHCNATTTPEAVVFDKDRRIVYQGRVDDLYVEVGQPRAEATTHDLADAIESTLLGRPVANSRTKAIGCLIADLKE